MVEAGKATIQIDAETKKLNAGMKKARNEVKSFGSSVSKMSIASTIGFAAAGAAALSFAKDAATSAIQFETTYTAFTNMVGVESGMMLKRMQIASRGTVSELDLVKNANTAMLLGIDAEALPKMMEISRAAARATGQDVGFMFQSIATGMGRQSRMILDNLGIIVNAEEAYEKYADSIGKATGQLTGAEMKIAFNNEVLAQGNVIMEKAGAETETAADKVEQFTATWADLGKEAGELALPLISTGVQKLTGDLKLLNEGIEQWRDLSKEAGEGFKPSFFGEQQPIFPGSPFAPGGGQSIAPGMETREAEEAGKAHAEYADLIFESRKRLQDLTGEIPKNNEEMNERVQAILTERDTLALLNKQAEESIPGLSKVIDMFVRMKLATDDLNDVGLIGSSGTFLKESRRGRGALRSELVEVDILDDEGIATGRTKMEEKWVEADSTG